jgi:hypothetical protein
MQYDRAGLKIWQPSAETECVETAWSGSSGQAAALVVDSRPTAANRPRAEASASERHRQCSHSVRLAREIVYDQQPVRRSLRTGRRRNLHACLGIDSPGTAGLHLPRGSQGQATCWDEEGCSGSHLK